MEINEEPKSLSEPNFQPSESITPEEKVTGSPESVWPLARALFAATAPWHSWGDDDQALFEQALRLQGEAWPQERPVSLQNLSLWLQERLQSSGEQPLPPEELSTLAAVLALSQGLVKPKKLAALGWDGEQSRRALALSALLHIARGLSLEDRAGQSPPYIETRPEEVWIVLPRPPASSQAGLLAKGLRAWNKLGYVPIEVLSGSEAEIRRLPLPQPQPKIGLQPHDELSEAGRKVLLFHFARLLSHEEGVRQGEDIEAVHDMRVATRRLRTALRVFEGAFQRRALRPYRRFLRTLGRALGEVRDLDVFLEKAERYAQSLDEARRPAFQPLLDQVQAERAAAHQALLQVLQSPEYAEFKQRFNIFVHTPGAGARLPKSGGPQPCRVNEQAPLLLYARMAAVRAFDPYVEGASLELLHQLRIELKMLRYTVEYFEEVLGKRARQVVETIKLLQDHLGELNDAQVATQRLRQFLDEWEARQASLPLQERQTAEEVLNYLTFRHVERHHLLITFPQIWREHFCQPRLRRALAQAVSVL